MTSHRGHLAGNEQSVLFESLLGAVVGGSIALAFSLMTGRSLVSTIVITLVSALLIGELTYSVLYFLRRTRDNRPDEVARIVAEHQAFESDLRARRKAIEDATEEPAQPHPYRHHEDHVESPGYDQGQLTASLPEPTPLLERRGRPPRS